MVVMFPKSIPLTRERKQYVASAQWFCHLPPYSYQLPPEHTSRLLSPLYIYNFSMPKGYLGWKDTAGMRPVQYRLQYQPVSLIRLRV